MENGKNMKREREREKLFFNKIFTHERRRQLSRLARARNETKRSKLSKPQDWTDLMKHEPTKEETVQQFKQKYKKATQEETDQGTTIKV